MKLDIACESEKVYAFAFKEAAKKKETSSVSSSFHSMGSGY
jgi:hypothetical protein